MYNHKKMHLHFAVKMHVMILCVLYLYQLSTKNEQQLYWINNITCKYN